MDIKKELEKAIKAADKDFRFKLNKFNLPKDFNDKLDVIIDVVDRIQENTYQSDPLDLNITVIQDEMESNYLCYVINGIQGEYEICIDVILDRHKKEDIETKFSDTHGQKCIVEYDDLFRVGVYNTGPHMVDSKINRKPPWRDDAMNRDVDCVIELNKELCQKIYPMLKKFSEHDEDCLITSPYFFQDAKGRYCRIGYSSIATYYGLWFGEDDNTMHLDVSKMKAIVSKLEEFLDK